MSGDVEALAEALTDVPILAGWSRTMRLWLAERILASDWLAAYVAAERDRAVTEALEDVADYRAAIERVQALHTQTSDIGLAPGKWCPACGQETPCQTILATLTPPPRLGHLSREELRQRALDFDMEEEHAQRRRESAALRAAPPAEPSNHDFLPVAGHPDDDECTHRADGTDATYCGRPRREHE